MQVNRLKFRILKFVRSFRLRVPSFLKALTREQKFAVLLTVDVSVIPVSVAVAAVLLGSSLAWPLIALLCVVGAGASILLGLPRIKLNTFEQNGIVRTAGYSVLVGLIGYAGSRAFGAAELGTSYFAILTMVLTIVAVSVRMWMRSILLYLYRMGHHRDAVVIYGAGQTGVQLADALKTDDTFEPVAFVDDNLTLQKVLVAGLPVYSPARMGEIVEKYQAKRVVLAMPSISRPKQARIVRQLEETGCDVVALPSFASLVSDGDIINAAQPVSLSDYLGRSDLNRDLNCGDEIYRNRTVMVTGAGGTIGSELTRQVLKSLPNKLVLFDVSEHALYQIDRELCELGIGDIECEVVSVLGSVTDERLVVQTLAQHQVDTVLHAAAYKHVPLVEQNILSGLNNNVLGTATLARAARDAEVGTFILVSTDKAVQPRSIMGASKRLAELLVQDLATRSEKTRFSIVRFGNVLGSSGSVVPLFEEQIARGGPVTLTHNDVTRFFMTITEAVRLVLLVGSQAHQDNTQGQVYVLDMGDPVSIRSLARRMIEGAGYTVCDDANPQGDIEIIVTGLRAGEKLHEKLSIDHADVMPTDHPKLLRVNESALSELEVASVMRKLSEAISQSDEQAALGSLNHWLGLSVRVTETKPKLEMDA